MTEIDISASPRLSAETLHASTVATDGRAVVIVGPSGAGKSDLALRLLDRGFTLVSDDRTIIKRNGDRLVASAPASLAGKLEIRGIGIVEMETSVSFAIAPHLDLVATADHGNRATNSGCITSASPRLSQRPCASSS